MNYTKTDHPEGFKNYLLNNDLPQMQKDFELIQQSMTDDGFEHLSHGETLRLAHLPLKDELLELIAYKKQQMP